MSDKNLIKEDADCCEVWPKIAKRLSWMQYMDQEGMSTLPYIEVGASKFLVNFCPSCGKTARNRKMKTDRIMP